MKINKGGLIFMNVTNPKSMLDEMAKSEDLCFEVFGLLRAHSVSEKKQFVLVRISRF